MVEIRRERENDAPGIHTVVARAFSEEKVAALVDNLRRNGRLMFSLVADDAGSVVGHIGFSPVVIDCEDEADMSGLQLSPLAVAPERQREGIGGMLVRAGLETCRAAGHELVFVLGDPDYYRRFGFVPAADYGLRWEKIQPDPAFQVILLRDNALTDAPTSPGTIRLAPEFDEV
jgi:putative acetyltransferase